MPDPALGHLLWQTVAGAWPLERERLHGYLEKAVREAGTRTRWTDPDEAFEAAMHLVADACYDDPALRAAVTGLVEEITPPGWSNSLSATLLQLAMPGVPDTYQGCELWDHSLVDPDNRRPVDFAARRELLERLAGSGCDGCREAARGVPGAADPPGPPGAVHRLRAGARLR